MSIIAI